jgi:hypothetical protein
MESEWIPEYPRCSMSPERDPQLIHSKLQLRMMRKNSLIRDPARELDPMVVQPEQADSHFRQSKRPCRQNLDP